MARAFTIAGSKYLRNGNAATTPPPLTLSAWAYSDSDSANQPVIGIQDSVASIVYEIRFRGDVAGDYIQALGYDGSEFLAIYSTAAYSINTWHHVLAIWYVDGSDKTVDVYLDGGNSATDINNSFTWSSVDQMSISANRAASPTIFFSGNLAEIAAWDARLTQREITMLSLARSPSLVRPQNRVAYWRLMGRNSPEIDIVGGYDMTLNNGPTWAPHPRIFYKEAHSVFNVPKTVIGTKFILPPYRPLVS